jgi:hypothetical protein
MTDTPRDSAPPPWTAERPREPGDRPPADEAIHACLALLARAALAFPGPESFPMPHVESDDGGIRCEWDRGDRTLSLVFSADGAARLHESGRDAAGERVFRHEAAPDVSRLVGALRWVAGLSGGGADES